MFFLLLIAAADPSALEAESWKARHALANKDYSSARETADRVRHDAEALLAGRALDADAHLPTALGAAIEVQAQTLAALGEGATARALLQAALDKYGKTSIAARLQKNLNLLTLQGKAAPPLSATIELAAKTPALKTLRGKPVLLLFWAHWCPDCKEEAPIVATLQKEFPAVQVIAPTQFYGFVAHGEEANQSVELARIQEVWKASYSALHVAGAPIDNANFLSYGASSVPTLVLIARSGKVALYHPGKMSEEELRATLRQLD